MSTNFFHEASNQEMLNYHSTSLQIRRITGSR